MNNKYQEALNNLSDYIDIKGDLNGEDNISHFNKQNVETLQELIDNCSKLEKALEMSCNVLEEGYGNKDAEYEYYTSLCDKKDIPKHMSSKQWKEWLLENE